MERTSTLARFLVHLFHMAHHEPECAGRRLNIVDRNLELPTPALFGPLLSLLGLLRLLELPCENFHGIGQERAPHLLSLVGIPILGRLLIGYKFRLTERNE